MALALGTRLGPYEVTALLGAGGMGEVYRARDTKLNRDVALKILPEAFTLDGDRIARFRREAQVLASLNHPNIAAIYGFEDSGSTHALVLELVEGPTLADRIAKGPIPLDEALPIAKQITEALEAAHEQGIIHRDLKPANIKLRDDGTVKVLDFGLAKALEPASAISPILTASPTITSPALITGMGMLLGTAAYMSPEQAKGRPADKRSDVWAFGCVLYEMLCGKRAFDGEDIAETFANVLKDEPDWSVLPASTPHGIRSLLHHALQKDRRLRIGDLPSAFRLTNDSPVVAAYAATSSGWRRAASVTVALLLGVIVTALAAWEWNRLNARAAMPARFEIIPPGAAPLDLVGLGGNNNGFGGANNPIDRSIDIAADGTRLVYRTGTPTTDGRLMVRDVDQLRARPVEGVAGKDQIREPRLSPDGRWIAFMTATELRKVSVAGGPSTPICGYSGSPHGLSWNPDGTILFSTSNGSETGIFGVSSSGGTPKIVVEPDRAHGERALWLPSMLPGSRVVLFTIVSDTTGWTEGDVGVFDIQSRQRKTVIHGATDARYVETGHIVYVAAGSLWAVPFDLKHLQATGDPVPIVNSVSTGSYREAEFAVSTTGTLIYVPSIAPSSLRQSSLVWVDRRGREEPTAAPIRAYTYARISPDGTRVALDIREQENDIWIWDLKRPTLTPTRLTFDPGLDRAPVWSTDSRWVYFASQREGTASPGNLFVQAADGSGMPVRLSTSNNAQYPMAVTPPDGRRLLFREDDPKTKRDIGMLVLDGKSQPASLIKTPYNEENPEVSPDGHWVAYQSDESGQYEIYVKPFPKVDGHLQVSAAGGTRPLWAPGGRELFYLDALNAMMAVSIQTAPMFRFSNPVRLFGPYAVPNNARTYDTHDGQHFLMIKEAVQADKGSAVPAQSVVVVLNWYEELKQRVPVK